MKNKKEKKMPSYEKYEQDCERIRSINSNLLEDFETWLATVRRYDDPDIEDMEEVWGFK
jgi:hypothetical protein